MLSLNKRTGLNPKIIYILVIIALILGILYMHQSHQMTVKITTKHMEPQSIIVPSESKLNQEVNTWTTKQSKELLKQ